MPSTTYDSYRPVDTFPLGTVGDDVPHGEVRLSVSAELMHNQQEASPIDPSETLEAVQDAGGNPVLVSIGNDDRLYLIHVDASAATGWSSIDLSASFPDHGRAAAFGLTQDAEGRISLCFALEKETGGTDVFVAYLLSSDLAATAWSDFASVSRKVEGLAGTFAAEAITLGTSDDGGAPLAMVAGNVDGEKVYHLVTDGTAERYDFPQDVDSDPDALRDFALGYAFGQRAIYYLYQIGESQTLACTTIADEKKGSLTYDFGPGNSRMPSAYRGVKRYNCIATSPGTSSNLSSDVYVGTDEGIYVFRNANVQKMERVTDQVSEAHQLIVTSDDEGIAVWAFCSPDRLYYVYGAKGSSYSWNAPILFADDVLHLAPIRNRQRRANEVLVVNQDHAITQHWQDPATTVWQERRIRLDDSGKTIDFTSYTVQLNLAAPTGEPIPDARFGLTCSAWTYVVVNGEYLSLDQETPATVSTDANGNVTVIYMCSDLSCPSLHFTADFLTEQVNVYAHGNVDRQLSSIEEGSDLSGATTEQGKPVVPSGYEGMLDGVAYNVGLLTQANAEMIVGTPPEGAVFTTLGRPTPTVMVSRSGGAGRTSITVTSTSAGSVEDAFDSTVGDVMKFLDRALDQTIKAVNQGVIELEDGTTFVIGKIEDVYQMTVKFADQVVTIVLDTVQTVYKAMTWLFNMIEVGLEMLLEWLGYLFDWGEILEISDELIERFNGLLNEAPKAIDALRNKLDGGFEYATEALAGNPSEGIRDVAGEDFGNGGATFLTNAPSSWGLYHLNYSGILDSVSEWKDGDLLGRMESTFGDLLEDDSIANDERAAALLTELAQNINSMNVGQAFDQVLAVVGLSAIDVVHEAMDTFLSMAEEFCKSVKKSVNQEIEIPLFNDLMGLLMEGRKFTVLRVYTIIIAAASRVAHKTLTGKNLKSKDLKYEAIDLGALLESVGSPYETSAPVVMSSAPMVAAGSPDREASEYAALDQHEIDRVVALGTAYAVTRELDTCLQSVDATFRFAGVPAPKFIRFGATVTSFGCWGFETDVIVRIKDMQTGTRITWWSYVQLSNELLSLLFQIAPRLDKVGPKAKTALRAWALVSFGLSLLFYTADYVTQKGELNSRELDSLHWRLLGNVIASVYGVLSGFPYDKDMLKGVILPLVMLSGVAFSGSAHAIIVFQRISIDEKNEVVYRIS